MNTNEDNIQEFFILDELDLHGEFLSDLFLEAIEKKKLEDSQKLKNTFINEMPYHAMKYGNGEYILSFNFPIYGRFIEIKSTRKIKTDNTDTNAVVWGVKSKRKKRKNAQWYTRNVYGAQNRLLSRLLAGFGDEERIRFSNLFKIKKKE